MTRPKYKPGPPIRSLIGFIANFQEGRPIYFRHKLTTHGWYQNWSLHLITYNIRQRYLYQALPAQEGQE